MSGSLPRWVPMAAAVGLFVVWSNSFVAAGYLLGRETAAAQLDWVSLTVARFATAGGLCAAYCAVFRRAESLRMLRRHWRRMIVCGALAVPIYNFAIFYAQEHGVAAPVASLVTSLLPLFVILLSVFFLGERLTVRRIIGFLVAMMGILLVATARSGELQVAYPALLAIAAIAPLSWSIYSVLSKPMAEGSSPVLWSYMVTAVGSLAILPMLGSAWPRMMALDGFGWAAVLYLAVPCAILGPAVWTWLLRYLPASSVGFTVFLNPPLTTLSKVTLAFLAPATFAFVVRPQEWWGGGVALLGMAIALTGRRGGTKGNVE